MLENLMLDPIYNLKELQNQSIYIEKKNVLWDYGIFDIIGKNCILNTVCWDKSRSWMELEILDRNKC